MADYLILVFPKVAMDVRRIFNTCLCMGLVGGACTDATEPVGELEVAITTSSSTVAMDQPLTITVSAVNQGDEPLTVRANSCPEAYRVRDQLGELVAPGPAICAAIALTKVLQPEERLEFTYYWAGTTRERISGPPTQLPLGRYDLHAVVYAEGQEFTSAPITVEVQQQHPGARP